MKKYNFTKTINMQRIFCFVAVVGMLFGSMNLRAQDTSGGIVVTGTISDAASKNPIIGARVLIAETKLSVLTGENGEYKITVPSTSDVLIISAPDYAIREVAVKGQQEINAQLFSTTFSSGYETEELFPGKEKRSSVITVPTNSASANFDRSASVSIESDIQARLGADVRTITRSGVPGMGAAMFIRGLNSLNSNAQPLIIVDGVIWDNQLNSTSVHEGFFLNPLSSIDSKDIENVTVIKDGNSIYGSKAANGVIIIDTKRGKDMSTRITANLSFGLNQKPSFPKMMNASQHRTYASNQIGGWIDQNSNVYPSPSQILNRFPFIDDNAINYRDYQNNTKWTDEVYRNGMVQNIGLSVEGGDEVALYNLSMGYSKNEGTVDNTEMERFNARFNSDIKMFSKVLTKVDISISRMTRDLRDDGMNTKTSPGFVSLIKSPMLAPHKYITGTNRFSEKLSDYDSLDPTLANGVSNPLAIIKNAMGTSSRTGFNMKVNPNYSITDDLTFRATFSYTMSRVKESFFVPETGIAPLIVNDVAMATNGVRDMSRRQNSVFFDSNLDWNHDFDKNNHLNLLGGFRFVSDSYDSMLPRGYNTGNDNVKILIEDIQNKSVAGTNDKWKTMSWYANAEYDYKKKYFLSLTTSADASSRFGNDTKDGVGAFGVRWGIFPAASAAWLISSEEFMKDVKGINLLKLRAGYSITGNDDIDPRSSRSYFDSVNYTDKATGLVLSNIENEKIQWETTKRANVGLDMHLFNDRLAVSADYYSGTTNNLLVLKSLESITGFDNYWTNDGKLKNKGAEVSALGKIINLPNFKWEFGASVGYYKNEVASLADGNYNTSIIGGGWIRTQVGQPIGVFYGYKTKGVFATTEEAMTAGYDVNTQSNVPLRNANGTAYQAGDMHFVDRDGNNIIDENDRMIIGDPNPDFYGNINTRFQYKKLTLDALFTYSYGNDVYNYLRTQIESGSSFYNQSTALLNRWTTEGQRTSIPRAVYGDPVGNNVFSDRWIEDGSYLRLKTITLSYDIPFKLSFLQGITVWGSVNNVFTLTKYLGSDPEFSMNNSALEQGIDNGLTPQGRSFLLGVKINL